MARDDKNIKDTKGSFRLAICSRLNHARRPLFQPESSSAFDPRRSIGRLRKIRNKPRPEGNFPRSALLTAETAPLTAHFLIANARLKFKVSHRKISPLKISNRERIAIFISIL
jgi:hypothetical protein